MNNSTQTPASLATYNSYVTVGVLAIITNAAVILVGLSNRKLIAGHAFVVGLAFGDILDGVSLVGNGATRIYQEVNNIVPPNIDPFQCLLRFSGIFLYGNQIPGVMFAIIGLERLVAIGYFEWYYAKWTGKKAWLLVLIAYGICGVSVTAIFIHLYLTQNNVKISSKCTTSNVVGEYYISYTHGVNIFGGAVATVTTVVAMVMLTRRKNKLTMLNKFRDKGNNLLSFVKNQCKSTKAMFYIALLDFGFVVVPNVLMALQTSGINLGVNVIAPSLVAVAGRSCFNIIIYTLCNEEFRKQLFYLVAVKKCGGKISTTTSQTVKNNTTSVI